jgi:hypothetical protein
MAFYIALGGTSLYRLTTAGAATALTLPTGVSVVSGRRPRFSVVGRDVIGTNAFSRSILIDPDFNVYPLQLRPPASAPVLSSSVSGNLSGTFKVKYTHIIKDPNTGRLIAESDFSPISASSGAISSKLLKAVVETSPDTQVTHRRLYRTTTGPGTTYFPWFDIDGNTLTSGSDDMSDAALQLVAAPTTLGSAPGMVPGTFMPLCVEWKGRLWGVGDVDPDVLRHTDLEKPYAWKSSFEFRIPPIGFDQYGVTALIPRRDELGVFKRNFMHKIVGNTNATFERIQVQNGKGCYAPESAIVIDDIAYYLGEDGVYTWGPEGITPISNGRVRKWFTTDTYFNRSQFPNAFAKYNAKYHGYELHLAAAGSSNIDRWVFYDIERGKWWGPHLTAAFTPTSALGFFIDTNSLTVPIVGGSDGVIYLGNRTTFNDDGSAISISAETARHSADTPDIKKLFHGPSFIFKKQSAAGNLSVACKVGALDASTTRTLSVTQTKPNRERFSPLGEGEYVGFVFTESTLNQGCELHGYELMTHELGRR